MSSNSRASSRLDAVVFAIVVATPVFAAVGAIDAHPEPTRVVLRAAALYGVGGAILAAALTLLLGVMSAVFKRVPTSAALGASGAVSSAVLLAGVYALYGLHAEVLAGTKWHHPVSLLATASLTVVFVGAAVVSLRFTARAPHVARSTRLVFRAAAIALIAATGWCLAQGPKADFIEPGETSRPNLVVIVLDTVRADFTSIHGFPQPVTPSFERLAREGLQFLDAQSTASWTLPAVTSLMTARLPGVTMKQGAATGGSNHSGLPEALSQLGYRTVLVSNNPYVYGPFGIAARFDDVDFGRPEWVPPATVVERIVGRLVAVRDADVVDGGIRWLERVDRPVFLYLHLMGGHSPYRAPPGYRSPIEVLPGAEAIDFPTHAGVIGEREQASLRSRYAATIRYADDQVARFLAKLDRLGLAESTIVVMTSDHGEELGDRGGWGHGGTLHQEVLHVPLVVRWPGRIPAGGRRRGVVSLMDLAPSLLAVIDPEGGPTPGFKGRDLGITARERAGKDGDGDRAFAEIAPGLRSVMTGRWKYVVDQTSGDEWLFDRHEDRRETTNLAPGERETIGELRTALAGGIEEADGDAVTPDAADPNVIRRLRELGYVQEP